MATKGVHMRVAHGEGRCSVSYSPDGKQLITSGADTLVKIFDADNFNAEPRNIEHHEEAITTLAVNAKGKFFATGTKDHMVSYFSYPAGEFQKLLVRLTVPIRQVSFDKTGRMLAVASDDAVIRMVNVGVAQYTSIRGHSDSILCVVFDPKGDYLASSSADGTVRIWDIRDDPECIKTLQVTGKVPQGDEGHPRAAQLLRIAWHAALVKRRPLAVPELAPGAFFRTRLGALVGAALPGGEIKRLGAQPLPRLIQLLPPPMSPIPPPSNGQAPDRAEPRRPLPGGRARARAGHVGGADAAAGRPHQGGDDGELVAQRAVPLQRWARQAALPVGP